MRLVAHEQWSEKVLDFQRVEVTCEENVRRVMVEATRLAAWRRGSGGCGSTAAPNGSAYRVRTLQDLIAAIIKDSEKKAQEGETAARRQELAVGRARERKEREQERMDKRAEHRRKEKEKAFERLISLPSEQQETGLAAWQNDSMRTLPPFATISQHLLAWKAGLYQQMHGISNSGPSRSRFRRSFGRSALRSVSTSYCALKRWSQPRCGR